MIRHNVRILLLGLAVTMIGFVLAAVVQITTSPGLPVWFFSELPKEIAANLRSRGCSIARQYAIKNHKNVLHDNFMGEGREDWAIFCISEPQEQVIVYGKGRHPATVLSAVPFIAESSPENSRSIAVVTDAYVVEHNRGLLSSFQIREGQHCIEHQVGMGSTIHCFVDGKWKTYAGAD